MLSLGEHYIPRQTFDRIAPVLATLPALRYFSFLSHVLLAADVDAVVSCMRKNAAVRSIQFAGTLTEEEAEDLEARHHILQIAIVS